ncbi:MAG: hypothetical protein H6711_01945 [Myxococcales bacterium]|nr:hypothetical protein [Myxococcales bacterium]
MLRAPAPGLFYPSILAAGLALVVGGCAGDDGGTGATETGGSTSAATATAGTSGSTGDASSGSTSATETTGSTGATETTGALPGDVPAPWDMYCIATFTEDTPALDLDFTFLAGESYLFIEDSFDPTMLYFGDQGPVEVSVAGGDPLPFTTNCDGLGGAPQHLAIFVDTTIYGDAALTQVACELSAGTVVPAPVGGGYEYVDTIGGVDVYLYTIGELLDLCPGATETYVEVGTANYFGADQQVFPIGLIRRPA